ncbi:MAG: hypothetical protein Q8Q22_00840 [bacterium]|nr:hypothetical protein [bacterium]
MMKFLRKGFELVQIVAVIAMAVFFFGAFLKLIVEPLAPVVTVLAVLLFTFLTFDKWLTAIMSVGGIALYAASWSAVSAWGVWPGMLVWSLGVLVWFAAVNKSFSRHLTMARTVAV